MYAYNTLGQVTQVHQADPDGAGPLTSPVTSYAYTLAGQVASVTDPGGGLTSYQYDDVGRVIQVTLPDPDGTGPLARPVFQTAYDKNSNVTSQTDALGNVTSYVYDALNRQTSVTEADPDGAGPLTSPVTSYVYDALSQLTSVTDALGRVTSYLYDNLGRLKSETLPDPDGAGPLASPVYQYAYDSVSNLTSVTDPLSRVTSYLYDNLNRLKQETLPDPDGTGPLTSPITTYSYDAASQLTSVTQPTRSTYSYTYDNLGRIKTESYPDPDGPGPQVAVGLVTYAYDAASNLTTVTNALGAVTAYVYDALHRRKQVTEADPDGAGPLTSPITTFAYDSLSRMTSVTDPLGRTTSYEYDGLSRTTKVTQPDPDGTGPLAAPFSTSAYDAMNNLTSQTDALGNVTQYQYDNLYRTKKLIEADPDGTGPKTSSETVFAWDSVGNRTSLTDPVGNITTWIYDGLDRVTSETNDLGQVRTFEYDAVGNKVKRTDRNGRVTEWQYDNLDRAKAELWKSGSTTIRTISYAYDAADQLTSASDPDASYTYAYDTYGRMTSATNAVGGPSIPLYFTYDALSRRTRMDAGVQMMGMADLRNEYYYDALDRLTRVDQNKGTGSYATIAEKRVDFAYNAAGQFTTITRYKDLDGGSTHLVATSSYEYDLIGRLTGLTHAKNSTTFADYDWAYDAHSRVTSQSRTHLVGGTQSTNYNYDNTGQLTGADNSTQTDESYSYDAAGNRDMSGYTTGDNNRMTSDGTFNYTYDNEGNRLTRTRISSDPANDYLTEYSWDYRNRLTKVTFKNNSGAVTKWVEFDYDPLDRRVEKRLDADGAGAGAVVKTFYVYDPGQDPVYGGKGVLDLQGRPLTQVLFEYNGSNQITHRYLYGPGVDFILADEAVGDEVLWALLDNLNSTRDVVDSAGNVEDHIEYNSFGLALSHTDPNQRFLLGYAGYVWDPDTGAYNARLRWYDASTGKWLSEDPIGFLGGDYNISRYVANGATNATDPSGLEQQARPQRSRSRSQKPAVSFTAKGTPKNKYNGVGNWDPVEFQKVVFGETPTGSAGTFPAVGCSDLAYTRAGDWPEDQLRKRLVPNVVTKEREETEGGRYIHAIPGVLAFETEEAARMIFNEFRKKEEKYILQMIQTPEFIAMAFPPDKNPDGSLVPTTLPVVTGKRNHAGFYNFATWFQTWPIGFWEDQDYGTNAVELVKGLRPSVNHYLKIKSTMKDSADGKDHEMTTYYLVVPVFDSDSDSDLDNDQE